MHIEIIVPTAEQAFVNYLERRVEREPMSAFPLYIGSWDGQRNVVLTQDGRPIAPCTDFSQAEAVLHMAERLRSEQKEEATKLAA